MATDKRSVQLGMKLKALQQRMREVLDDYKGVELTPHRHERLVKILESLRKTTHEIIYEPDECNAAP